MKQKIKYLIYPIILKLAKVNKKKPTINSLNKEYRKIKVIVSLTSFPGRINIVHKTIYTIFNQKFKPDKIVLWLADTQFPNKEKDLPKELLELKKIGLDIKWCKDIKSYKKIIPSLKKFPNDIIVTIDDDIYYPDNMLKNLYDSYKKNPKVIHCQLITRIGIDENNNICSVKNNKNNTGKPSFNNKLLGGSGTLYPPHVLNDNIFNENEFMTIAPTSDDLWAWTMAIINGTKILWIKKHMYMIYNIEHSQEETECLWKINDVGENLFQKHISDLDKKYNIKKIIDK